MEKQEVLFKDGFDRFPLEMFSADVGPQTEYHFRQEAAPRQGWGVACFFHDGSKTAWQIAERDGRRVFRQTFRNDKGFTHPMVSAGDPQWTDYEAEILCSPSEAGGRCGLVFRYETNRRYYFWGLVDGGAALVKVCEERRVHEADETVLGFTEFHWQPGRAYWLRAEVRGAEIRCFAEDTEASRMTLCAVEAGDDSFGSGKIALTSDVPADFLAVEVWSTTRAAAAARQRRSGLEAELEELRAGNPRPVVWKKLATPGFGVGRNLRFGDLDGDGRTEILVPQVIQHGPRDAYAEVGCLTALDLDGRVLWRHGEPDPGNWFLTNDVAVQIHDVDGDGAAEVVYCRDFELRIVEGATGRIKRSIRTPESCEQNDKFPRILGDSLFFCDVRGLGRKGDILLKDRYWNFWVYDDALNLLWKGGCKTGHYPHAADIDGDGRDEIAIGYSLYDHDGRLLWSHDERLEDHSDGVALVNLRHPPASPTASSTPPATRACSSSISKAPSSNTTRWAMPRTRRC
ncbi:MAG: hypothetical protein HC888_12060 [Candidatus Competibacteraceae bacterium]|nr:hypothetical protein [Candidatus Competibacteraceae bacterium]